MCGASPRVLAQTSCCSSCDSWHDGHAHGRELGFMLTECVSGTPTRTVCTGGEATRAVNRPCLEQGPSPAYLGNVEQKHEPGAELLAGRFNSRVKIPTGLRLLLTTHTSRFKPGPRSPRHCHPLSRQPTHTSRLCHGLSTLDMLDIERVHDAHSQAVHEPTPCNITWDSHR